MQTFATSRKDLFPDAAARRIFGLIKKELALVEQEFERQASSNIQVINYLGDYLRVSGGKRVRPALLLLATYAAGGRAEAENVIGMATVMEMLHTATLVHDDIIDNADIRRNRPSVNARFGNHAAVLMGDWLYMSAFETSLRERSLAVLDVLTNLTRKMTEGELIQLTLIGNAEITEDEYFDVIRRKTAYLFSGCCEIGGLLAGAGPAEVAAMRDYGLNLGIAFQIADDLLDYTADRTALGKATGADLLEGKITLPLILLLKKNPGIRSLLEKAMLNGELTEDGAEQLKKELKDQGIIGQTRDIANNYASAARKNLEVLPETEYRVALDGIPEYVIDREK